MIKVLHTADWHYRDKDHDGIEKCVDFLIASARQENPDLILISGDITDNQNLKLDSRSARTICRQVSELACIAPVAIIIGTPSHDGKSAEILRYVRGKYQIHVSESPEQLLLSGGRLYAINSELKNSTIDAILTQIPTPTKQFFQSEAGIIESDQQVAGLLSNLLGAFGAVASQFPCPHIVSGHFQMGGAYISETQQLIGRDIEISVDQMAMANAHLVCLGHIHKQQEIGDNIYYSGSIYRKTFGETESKGFYYHDLSLNTPNYLYGSEFIYVPARQMIKISVDFTSTALDAWNFSDLEDFICRDYIPPGDGAHIKLEFKAWQDEAGQINQAALERALLDAGAERVVISLIRVPRETVRATRVLQAESLSDKIIAMTELRGEPVAESILNKAATLETVNPDELIKLITAGRVA